MLVNDLGGARDGTSGSSAGAISAAQAVALEIRAAGVGTFEVANITLTLGVWIGSDAKTPERLAARFAEVSARHGEIVPQSGRPKAAMRCRRRCRMRASQAVRARWDKACTAMLWRLCREHHDKGMKGTE